MYIDTSILSLREFVEQAWRSVIRILARVLTVDDVDED